VGLTVLKCGGSQAIKLGEVCADVARLRAAGGQVVVVHGGAGDMERLARQLGVRCRRLVSPLGFASRYTDTAMLDVLMLAMTGRAKPRLLMALTAAGVSAVGLTGLDAGLLRAVRKKARRAMQDGRTTVVRGDHSGRIVAVDPSVLQILLNAGLTPVVSPPATGENGAPLNVDADRVAAAVATALRADYLLSLTAAPGVLRDADDESSVLERYQLPDDGDVGFAASDGMYRKLIAAYEALRGGVPQVRVADGRTRRPVYAALRGAGTAVVMRAAGTAVVMPGAAPS